MIDINEHYTTLHIQLNDINGLSKASCVLTACAYGPHQTYHIFMLGVQEPQKTHHIPGLVFMIHY